MFSKKRSPIAWLRSKMLSTFNLVGMAFFFKLFTRLKSGIVHEKGFISGNRDMCGRAGTKTISVCDEVYCLRGTGTIQTFQLCHPHHLFGKVLGEGNSLPFAKGPYHSSTCDKFTFNCEINPLVAIQRVYRAICNGYVRTYF
ncbi:hypothetical protein TNIN_309981 [Trichonephila inaurata madagascariensis]|uniref:Uncharacterized protein n=1 Tax=Trichonephila inaurata madagascariensis TaxID=2747483 RepID=A0A8X6JL84_9ARAC|nr:hypothetical protein TNIN_309981 [Trichonephila inaurata madagascariensis]